jgi:TRAP-type uncharacterized transport system fused permease subunit
MVALGAAVLGIIPFAAGIAGHLFAPVPAGQRALLFLAAALLLLPADRLTSVGPLAGLGGLAVLAVVAAHNWRSRRV